jgi:hypothetical protein
MNIFKLRDYVAGPASSGRGLLCWGWHDNRLGW